MDKTKKNLFFLLSFSNASNKNKHINNKLHEQWLTSAIVLSLLLIILTLCKLCEVIINNI